jgi:hypothetical protein
MPKISTEVIQRVITAAKQKSGKDFTYKEVEQGIASYFDPKIPPPNLSQEQMDAVVRSLMGEEEPD